MLDIKIKATIGSLIGSLEANKAAHIADYKVAREIYFIDLRTELEDMRKDACEENFRADQFGLNLRPPRNEAEKYDKYINMLNLSTESIIEIGVDEYERFVEDKWDWAISARNLNSIYSSKASF